MRLRLEGERALEAGGRIAEPCLRLERKAQVLMIEGIVASEPDRLPDQLDGRVVTAGLVCQDPKQMQAVGVAGIDREDAPVEPFGLVQPPGPVAAGGLAEQALNGAGKTRLVGNALLLRHVAIAAVHRLHST